MVIQQLSHMRNGVACTHEEFIIELKGAVTHTAVELLYECDGSFLVVLVYDTQFEEFILSACSTVAVSPSSSFLISLSIEDFGKEDLLVERVSICLVVNLEVVHFQVVFESILLVILLTFESESFDCDKHDLFAPRNDLFLVEFLHFAD